MSTFAQSVGEWERKLNLVAEVQEVWQLVQTKWQYLEGIFVGESREWHRGAHPSLADLAEASTLIWHAAPCAHVYASAGSEDIRLQLPEEAKRFAGIDKDWKNIMTATGEHVPQRWLSGRSVRRRLPHDATLVHHRDCILQPRTRTSLTRAASLAGLRPSRAWASGWMTARSA